MSDFIPPQNGGTPLSLQYIFEHLAEKNIKYGIQHGEINKAYEECLNNETVVVNVLVAKGEPALNEIPEYLQLNPVLEQKKQAVICEKASIDHRERSPFIIIKKDMPLAKLKRLKPGKEGMNIHGEATGFNVTNPVAVLAGGENTRMEDRYLFSNINGQLVINKKVVSVRDSLIIAGSVGYGTGNIIFPGNVEIHGTVGDGFKIYSGGAVTIKQTFDVTDAVIKGDLNVAGGIIGRGRALVKVGGTIKTKFIENCRIACRKTINVDVEILGSKVFTLENIVMTEKGRIVGGEVYALKGVRAGGIGRKTGKAARIHCGVDFTLEQEKEKNNALLRIIDGKLRHLAKLMEATAGGEKLAKMQAVREHLESEQRKAQEKVSEILGTVNAYEDATVEVRGEIAAGTLIEICQRALFLTEPLKKVRIRLDKELNTLVTEKL
jgi:uncharacterized protein (DUF342 family)